MNVRLVVPFSGIEAAPKALVIAGGLITVRVAEDVLCAPVPAAVELMVTLLFSVPSVVPVTLTVMVHELAASALLEKLTLPEPAVAVTVPPQLLVTPGVDATCNPAGNVSVKLPSTATTFGLVMAKLSVVVPFTGMVAAPKLLVMCSGSRITISAVTVAWSTVAPACPSPPVAPALKVAVACAFAPSVSGCACGMVPRTGLLKVIGKPITSVRFAAAMAVPWLSWARLPVSVVL